MKVSMLSGTSKPSFAPNEQILKVALQRLLLSMHPSAFTWLRDAWRYNTVASMAPNGGTIHTLSFIVYYIGRKTFLPHLCNRTSSSLWQQDYPQSGWMHFSVPNFWVMLEGFPFKSHRKTLTSCSFTKTRGSQKQRAVFFFGRKTKKRNVQF